MNELRVIGTPNHKPKKRYASIDFQRGFAIWIMTFFHAFDHLYDHTWVEKNPQQLLELPKIISFFGAIIAFISTWNAYFLLLSSTVNTLSVIKKAKKGMSPQKLFFKQFFSGAGILGIGMVHEALGYGGYFGWGLRYGSWSNTYPLWKSFFTMQTLHIIGWSMIINSFIQFLLVRNDGYKKIKRNILVYGTLAFSIIFLSPIIHNFVDNLSWEIPPNPPNGLNDNSTWPSNYFQAYNASFKSWFFTIIAGDMEPLFPYLATCFIGSLVGLGLAEEKPVKRLPMIGGISALFLMGIGGIFISQGYYNLNNCRPRIGNYLLTVGGQLAVMMLLLWLVEYRGKANQFATNKYVKHFRLWGIASLSIYCLGILELLPRWFLGKFLSQIWKPINLVNNRVFGKGYEVHTIVVAAYIMLFFELLVALWSRYNFKFSFEWFLIRFSSLGNKEISYRLNVNLMLNNIHWIDCQKLLHQSNRKITKEKATSQIKEQPLLTLKKEE
jgi:hypothetical protein